MVGGFFTKWATRQAKKKKKTEMGSLSLLQGIFLTQESNVVSCIAGWFFTCLTTREACFQLWAYKIKLL